MEEMDAVALRLACLEGKMWALLLHYANLRDLVHVRELLELIEVVEQI